MGLLCNVFSFLVLLGLGRRCLHLMRGLTGLVMNFDIRDQDALQVAMCIAVLPVA